MKTTWLKGMALGLCCGVLALCGCDRDDDSGLTGDEMYISPASYRFRSAEDKTTSVRVHGAKPPFQWSLSDSSLGTLTGVPVGADTTIDLANYTRTPSKYGANTIIVRDSRGWQASCVMTVPERLDDVATP